MTTSEKILVFVLALLFSLSLYLWIRVEYKNKQYQTIEAQAAALTGQVSTYKDENGTLHGQVQSLTGDKEVYTILYKNQIDSMANLLKIKGKDINNFVNVGVLDSGKITNGKVDTFKYVYSAPSGLPDIINNYPKNGADSALGLSVSYSDKWLNFKGKIMNNGFSGTYSINDSMTVIGYSKSTGFLGLGPTQNFVDISSTNPNVQYKNMKSVILTSTAPKRFSIGPYVGYDIAHNQVSFGVSFQYSLIRF